MRNIFECVVIGVEMPDKCRMTVDVTGSAEVLRYAADRYLFAVQFTVVILETMHRVGPLCEMYCVRPRTFYRIPTGSDGGRSMSWTPSVGASSADSAACRSASRACCLFCFSIVGATPTYSGGTGDPTTPQEISSPADTMMTTTFMTVTVQVL